MAEPPVTGHNTTSDHLIYKTWILRVYIHCDGCKKKVFKVLKSIDGVYKTVIDSQQHKAIVTGSIDGDILVQKLLKSGKHAEILPESFEATAAADNATGNSKKKKKKSNKPKDGATTADDHEHVDDEKKESEPGTAADGNKGENDQVPAQPAVAGDDGGKKKKKKKGKGGKNNNSTPPNDDTEGAPTVKAPTDTGSIPGTTETVGASMEQLNLNPPLTPMSYATPFDLPPYQNYYPTPAYGMSYSTSYPSTESSYYAPPVYGYAQSHASAHYPPPPPPWYYPRSAFDDHDDADEEGRACTIM